MSRFSIFLTPLRLLAAIFSVFAAFLVFAPSTAAATLDFDVPAGNYNAANNWEDDGGNDPALAPPGVADNAFVRNDGTVTVNTNVANTLFRIGASRVIQVPDPIDPNILIDMQIGMPGTLDWTAGEITGGANGPDIRVGQRDNGTDTNFTGTVVQNGPTTKVSLTGGSSRITIGDSGSTPSPTSSYTLMDGTIGYVVGSNSNNGINVRNGTFTMTGGSIIDESPIGTEPEQRFLTISTTSGSLGTENVATATFTGGTVNVLGGIRAATSSHSRGYLNINGPVTMQVGSDVSIGYNNTNGVGEMNMSDGQLTIGTAAETMRLQIGHRGPGTLNFSGGIINVTNDLRVGAELRSTNSLINMTGGTLTTGDLQMNLQGSLIATEVPRIIIDGPSANFLQGPGGAGESVIGENGAALFEVRQGQATLSTVELGNDATSSGIVNLMGGKLTLTGPVNKSNAAATPAVNLTGGILEISPTAAGATTWATDLINNGSELILKPDTVQQLTVTGGNFAMNSGIWDLEIGSNAINGADRIVVGGTGTGAINGGMINISHLPGYTPAIGDTLFLVRALAGGVSLNAGAVSLVGDPNWRLVTNAANTEVQLTYVPEPSSIVLGGLGLLIGATMSRRPRIRSSRM